MSVGEETIDRQHQKLLNQVNKMIDSVVFGVKSKEMKEAVDFFGKYADEHLAYEEKYMLENGYPELEAHKKKHQDFRNEYEKFKKELSDGADPKDLVTEIEKFLGSWWIEHIGREDKKYYSYFSSQNK